MMGEAKHEARAVFTAALALSTPEERARFLDEACQGKPELRHRVEDLLRAHEKATHFLEVNGQDSDALREGPGTVIGRYKLLEEIGEGAFGRVFMAEQTEPVCRKVALKIIKAGMDTREVIARFEAERQALALMDHPNIAKVLDAGATETGRPYFVMELVRGIPITAYSEQQKLSTTARLELFMKVCHAVQHAHQKGIIHRDLKPTNILVTLIDGDAVPRVIDFGIAKALGQKLTEKTLFTGFQQMIGTPAYMSPEQAALSGVDVDTRSDIYSLGVLLYELLTGVTPFDQETLRKAALDEICRLIRETEPPKPSTRLTELAKSQKSEVRSQQWKEVRGDLDWIVMKCLEKNRTRRYETANGLANDIERHLHHEPVTAAAPSALYRAGKFVRRHKAGLAVAGALVALLAAGAVISTWQAVRATRAKAAAIAEKQRADKEAATANRITEYVQQMLYAANPEATKDLNYSVRQLLDDFSGTLEGRLADQPEVEAALHATIGNAYWGLQEPGKAKHHLTRALELRRDLFRTQHEKYADSLVDYAVSISLTPDGFAEAEADLHQALAIYRARGIEGRPVIHALWALQMLFDQHWKYEEIEPVVNEALAEARKSPSVQYWELAAINHGLIKAKIAAGRYAEAESIARETVTMENRVCGPENISTAWGHIQLNWALLYQHKFKEAMAEAKQSLAIMRKRVSPDHWEVGAALSAVLETLTRASSSHALTELFSSADQLAEMESLFRGSLLAKPRAPDNGFDPVNVVARGRAQFPLFYIELGNELSAAGRTLDAGQCQQKASALLTNLVTELAQNPQSARTLAQALHTLGRTAEARALYVNLIAQQRQQLKDTDPVLGTTMFDFAEFLNFDAQDPSAAAEQYLQALPIRRAGPDTDLAWTLRNLGNALLRAGRPKEAEPYCREGLEVYRKVHPQDDATTAWVQHLLAQALRTQGNLPEAEQLLRQALKTYVELAGGSHSDTPGVIGDLTDVLRSEGKLGDIETLFRDEVAARKKRLGNEHPDVASALHKLGDVLRDSGKWGEAEAAFREAVAMRRKLFGNEHLDLAHSLHGLAWVLNHEGKRVEAEQLSREELAMRRRLLGDVHPDVAATLEDLARFLYDQEKWAEARAVRREALLMRKKLLTQKAESGDAGSLNELAWLLATNPDPEMHDGPSAVSLAERAAALTERKQAYILDTLAAAYAEAGQYTNAVCVQQEAIALLQNEEQKKDYTLRLRLYESATPYHDPNRLAERTRDLLLQEKFAEAEALARECLAIREKQIPDDWRTFNARSMVGGALLGQKKYAEAEPLLLAGYEGMKQRETQIPPAGKPRLKETLQRLVQLYEETNRPDKAAEWKQKLAQFEQAETEKQPAPPPR
jgi:hypothetical protein